MIEFFQWRTLTYSINIKKYVILPNLVLNDMQKTVHGTEEHIHTLCNPKSKRNADIKICKADLTNLVSLCKFRLPGPVKLLFDQFIHETTVRIQDIKGNVRRFVFFYLFNSIPKKEANNQAKFDCLVKMFVEMYEKGSEDFEDMAKEMLNAIHLLRLRYPKLGVPPFYWKINSFIDSSIIQSNVEHHIRPKATEKCCNKQ